MVLVAGGGGLSLLAKSHPMASLPWHDTMGQCMGSGPQNQQLLHVLETEKNPTQLVG